MAITDQVKYTNMYYVKYIYKKTIYKYIYKICTYCKMKTKQKSACKTEGEAFHGV